MSSASSKLEIILPRSTYYHGETIVGLARLSNITNTSSSANKKLKILITGACKIDSRWYNTKDVINFYGMHPVLQQLSMNERENIIDNNDNTICFYSTNIIEYSITTDNSNNHNYMFGSDISYDLPHSATFTSCKYYYTIIALYNDGKNTISSSLSFLIHSSISSIYQNPTAANGDNNTTVRNHNINDNNLSLYQKSSVHGGGAAARLKIGSCYGISSSILSSYLELNLNDSKVQKQKNRYNNNINNNDIKSIRISNEHNVPYCILTIINSTIRYPGSTIELLFHFHNDTMLSEHSHKTNIKQIMTSIQGIEYTFYDFDCTAKKTKTYILDNVIRNVTKYMNFVSIILCLPYSDNDCPYSISTDLVELSIFCIVELIIIDENDNELNDSNDDNYDEQQKINEKKMSFQFPINVVHNSNSSHDDDDNYNDNDDEEEEVIDLIYDDDNINNDLLLDNNGISRNCAVNIGTSDKEDMIDLNDKIICNDLIALGSYLKEKKLL